NDWFAEADRIIAQTLADADHEASEIVFRARSFARRVVDEARAEPGPAQPGRADADGLVDARSVMARVEGLADTIADMLSAIDQTVAIAGVMAGRITNVAALPPGSVEVELGQKPAEQVAAAELDSSVSRLFARVEDMLHSLDEVRAVVDSAVARRPPWESRP
ncbi:MAG TPA: hypothetical protein VG435_15490, partial [Acidimicrobiales bacterium]|nr:hypothetical protein [Acidimicrobiales bacterium]